MVDHEPDIAEPARLVLEVAVDGVKDFTAGNSEEVIEMLRNHSIDLPISDYRMPIIDGLRFLGIVQHEFLKVPCIMRTAHPDAKRAAEAVE